jgi:hypothetical protein
MVAGEVAKLEGEEDSTQKRRQKLLSSKAAYLVIRAQIALFLKVGSAAQAMGDVLEALALTTHRSDLRVRMAAITVLSTLLIRFGTLDNVTRALQLLDQADKELARRRFRRSHSHRVLIRWGKALALARLGMVDRAEQIMAEVIEKLIAAGARQDAENAVEALAWIVEERAGKQGRANYLRGRYGARLAEGVGS